MSAETIVSILWTGGYDSTFRMCQLSKKDITIQPYYVSDNRQSEEYELKAIDVISKKLEQNPDTKATIKPIIYVAKADRKKNEEITKAFKRLLKKDYMGSQYDWLGAFSAEHIGIEMSIHKDDKAIALIAKNGTLKKQSDFSGEYYVIDTEKSPQDLVTVFGNYHFPLVDYTKVLMKDEYTSMGLSDVIDDTWFCFSPIDGKPCGCCNPCRYTIEEGMPYRFSQEALARYKKSQTKTFKIKRDLMNLFKAVVNKIRNIVK